MFFIFMTNSNLENNQATTLAEEDRIVALHTTMINM